MPNPTTTTTTIELIREHGIDMGRLLLDDEDAATIVEEELNAPRHFFDGLSILQAAESGTWCIYSGLTSRTLEIEGLRWLCERGANHVEDYVGPITKNRPVLQLLVPRLKKRKAGDDPNAPTFTNVVTESHAEELGFKCELIYVNSLRLNASLIEDGLQEGIDHVPLGQRLHRHVAMGRSIDDLERWGPESVTKVFVTYIERAKVLGEEGGGPLKIVP